MYCFILTEDQLRLFADEDTKTVFNQRFLITVNDSVSWRGGSVSLGEGRAYITLSGARMKKLGIREGDQIRVTLEKDHSEFGFDVPPEFTEVLKQDPEAQRRFNALTKGFQRYIIYAILQYKTSGKRIEKSIFLLENLKKSPEGSTTMRHILGKDLP